MNAPYIPDTGRTLAHFDNAVRALPVEQSLAQLLGDYAIMRAGLSHSSESAAEDLRDEIKARVMANEGLSKPEFDILKEAIT